MAITIQATPTAYSSVQGDLIYTVAEVVHTADPVTYPNYKFIGDVYVGGVLVARIKKQPDPVTNIGIFNIGQIVRNYIAVAFNPTANAIVAQRLGDEEFWLSVQMKFGEEYSYTEYIALTNDSARVFFNNYNGRLAGGTTSLTLLDKALTDRPYATPVRDDSTYNFIPFFATDTDGITVTIKTYNYSNTLVDTISKSVTPGAANELIVINASKAAINAEYPGTISNYIKYYTVLFTTPNIADDVTYQFNMVCEVIHEIFTLHFLNKYGGFESKDFTKVSRKTINIEKKDFGKLPYTIDSSGVVSYKNANNVYNESRSVYSSQYKEKMTLNSDLLTDAEYVWLEQLILTTMAYIEIDGYFYPCVISENNYERKKVVNDELTNLTLNVEFGEQFNAQYR